jgi:hypothetical protein
MVYGFLKKQKEIREDELKISIEGATVFFIPCNGNYITSRSP